MRFKAVISLCKKTKQVILCDHKGIQWIGAEDPATAEKLGRALAAVAAQLTEG